MSWLDEVKLKPKTASQPVAKPAKLEKRQRLAKMVRTVHSRGAEKLYTKP